MKKILFLVLCVMISMMGKAETVKYEDGFLGTSAEFKFTIEMRSDSVFLIVNVISPDVKIMEDAKMLIKFYDNSIIKLTGERKDVGLLTSVSGSVFGVNGQTYGGTTSTNSYFSQAEFPISKADIEKFKNGIKKIRINTSPDIHTKQWNKDKIGEKLFNQFSTLMSNSFEDNF